MKVIIMIRSFFALLCVVSVSACASITGEGVQSVAVKTSPANAKLTVDGQIQRSPAVFQLKGDSDYTVVAEKEGYETTTTKIKGEPRILAAVVGNIFNLTGIIGMAVDFFATGAAYDLDDNVEVTLDKK